jgi:hypothetical protein
VSIPSPDPEKAHQLQKLRRRRRRWGYIGFIPVLTVLLIAATPQLSPLQGWIESPNAFPGVLAVVLGFMFFSLNKANALHDEMHKLAGAYFGFDQTSKEACQQEITKLKKHCRGHLIDCALLVGAYVLVGFIPSFAEVSLLLAGLGQLLFILLFGMSLLGFFEARRKRNAVAQLMRQLPPQ